MIMTALTAACAVFLISSLAVILACAFVLGRQPKDERELAGAWARHPSASRPSAAPPLLPYVPRPRDGGPNTPRSKP